MRGLVLKKDRTKVKQLEMLMCEHNAAIACVTESWLDESNEPGEVKIKDFSLYRADRIGRKHGGVCVYLRSNIP